MIRTDVGDVPPWMDEGIASIYETSRWKGDVLTGDVDNWRTNVLRTADQYMSNKIPQLNDFLKHTWLQFDGIESNDICRAAINYAYGKHFMLYCQSQGKLPELVTALKNRIKIINGTEAVFQSDSALLEKVYATTLDTIEKRFNYWLYIKYNLTMINGIQYWKDVNQPNSNGNTINQPVPLPEVTNENANQVLFDKEPEVNNQQMVQQMPINVANRNAANVTQLAPYRM